MYGYKGQDVCCFIEGHSTIYKPVCYMAAMKKGKGLVWTTKNSSIIMLGGESYADEDARQEKLRELDYLTINKNNEVETKKCPKYHIYDYIKTKKCIKQTCPYRFFRAPDGTCQWEYCKDGLKYDIRFTMCVNDVYWQKSEAVRAV